MSDVKCYRKNKVGKGSTAAGFEWMDGLLFYKRWSVKPP